MYQLLRVEQSCAIGRAPEPSVVILEDGDLVAQERSSWEPGCNAVLFELLNQMDGLPTTRTSCFS